MVVKMRLLIDIFLLINLINFVIGTTHKRTGNLGRIEEITVNSAEDYTISYDETGSANPYRVHVWSSEAKVDFPVLVVVKQEKRVMSWQVPLTVKTDLGIIEYTNTSRTLCYDAPSTIKLYHKYFDPYFGNKKNFTITISTFSSDDIVVYLQTSLVENYFLQSNKEYTVQFSPSEPIFMSYDFPQSSPNQEEIETVLVYVNSDDLVCFVVSVQPKLCPVHDLNDDIMYQGKYQTVNTKGGLTIAKSKYPDGFYLVFVSKADNHDCQQSSSMLPNPRDLRIEQAPQTTIVTFEIRLGKTQEEYLVATMVILWTIIGTCLLLGIFTILFYHFGRYKNADIEDTDGYPTERILRLSPDEIDSYFEKSVLKVSDFVRRGVLNNKKSLNYFWHVSNIALFYGIPVVQLMVSYQRAVNVSGNLDLCYHNFYCSHPLYFTDFNHIYSNIGYVFFGLLFLGVTYFRNKKIRNRPNCGIPKFYGLYYSMGMALVFEGVLSACYHVCPTQSNFQFDTSFMYIMAVLIMVKLYQNRHPDINASAYSTFFVLGVAIILAMFGILYNNTIVMVVFIFGYVTLCLYMAFKIYFFGHVVKGWKLLYKCYKSNEPISSVIKPIRKGRFITLTVANICNLAIAITGSILYPSRIDFGSFLLNILLLNSIVHAIFYMIMKLVHHEKICFEAIMYGILAILAWLSAIYFFFDAATTWEVTPAESRQLNKECMMLDFYDTHDIWHLVSAPALFFSFMFLLTLDDDLFETPQSEIDVF